MKPYNTLSQLLQMSRRAGERFDLVQAGGGNTSAKLDDGKMYVKASGLRLSDLNSENSFVLIDNLSLRKAFVEIDWTILNKRSREQKANEIVNNFNLTADKRPSIETLLHSILDEFVLHTHPVQVTAMFSDSNAAQKCKDLLPGVSLVTYETPGVDLALNLMKAKSEYEQKFGNSPSRFVFQNHGLVTTGKSAQDALQATDEICNLLSSSSGLSFLKDQRVNFISDVIERIYKESFVTIFSPNSIYNELSLKQLPFFPDGVVFLGILPLKLEETSEEYLEKMFQSYLDEFSVTPRVIVFLDSMYFVGKTFSKAKESEEVWRLHHIASQFQPQSLSKEEISFLSHWEAEKYRQKI